jgi:hypothetical protein
VTGSTIFPAAIDDGCEPFRQIASRLRCDEDLVHDAFMGLGVPEWEIPTHLDTVKKTTHALNEAARHAENLLRALLQLSQNERDDLIVAGAPTFHQIEFLRDTLSNHGLHLKSWSSMRHRGGGRNPAAYIIAEGMRRVFRRLRKNITFGNLPDGSGPSTEFGKEVKFALGAFGVLADWRRPTAEASDKQREIRAQMIKCQTAKLRRENLSTPPTSPDLTGIDIRAENESGSVVFVVSLIDSPEIPPFKMQSKNVPNGSDVTEYAYQWATSVRAAKP